MLINKNMNINTEQLNLIITISTYVFCGIIALLIARICFLYGKSVSDISDGVLDWTKQVSNNKTRISSRSDKIRLMLSRKGFMYRFNDYELVPLTYLLFKTVITIVFCFIAVLFFGFSPIVLVVSLIAGFFFLDALFNALNKSDNESMADDIQNLYFTFIVHAEAGVHVLDSIRICMVECDNKRLKEALNEFINIVSTNRGSITDAINILRNRFDNKDITNFAAALRQAEETGVSAKMINSLLEQINAREEARNYEKEKSSERKMMLLLVAFIIGILGLFLVGLIGQMKNSINFF